MVDGGWGDGRWSMVHWCGGWWLVVVCGVWCISSGVWCGVWQTVPHGGRSKMAPHIISHSPPRIIPEINGANIYNIPTTEFVKDLVPDIHRR
jgi:hypothetical protein